MQRFRPTFLNRTLDAILPLPEANWDADWRVRLPASAVLAAARAALLLPHRRPQGTGDGVLAFYHLGDQLRMLNVLSRFPLDEILVETNDAASAPLSLYANVRRGRTFAHHGLFASFVSTKAQPPLARMLIPHPTMTMPPALGYARRRAACVYAASTGEFAYASRDTTFVEGDRSSWRSYYESFFRHVFRREPTRATPALQEPLRHDGRPSRRIVAHLTAGMAERRMPVRAGHAILRELTAAGFEVTLLGTPTEAASIGAMMDGLPVATMLGQPLDDVARRMADSAAFVGLESSMMHLADAVGVPAVVIYAATSPEVQGPFYTRTVPVSVAEPSITCVSALTGRLAPPQPAWERVDRRVGEALAELLATEYPHAAIA